MLQGTPCDATGRQGKLSLSCRPAETNPCCCAAGRGDGQHSRHARRINQVPTLGRSDKEVENRKACGQKMVRGDEMEKG